MNIPRPINEPVLTYRPGSSERAELELELKRQSSIKTEIPLLIGSAAISTHNIGHIICPHNRALRLATFSKAGEGETKQAIAASQKAAIEWRRTKPEDRAAVFLKAADLISGPYRQILNAATMLGQSKTFYQAEIDAACELADFWRFNAHYMQEIYEEQPTAHSSGVWNRMEYRPLEGFTFALTPFNFTAIGGNLPTCPVIMGGVSVWKPASTAVLSAYYIMKILHEAGLPDGVINMIPGDGSVIGNVVLNDRNLAGIHFTGSTQVFNMMWKKIGENLAIGKYRNYPRIVGETGGKDFMMVHRDADIDALAAALVRGAFEYQGQKCSATSRAYIPRSIWKELKGKLISLMDKITMGDVSDFNMVMGAVIDERSFENISYFIKHARTTPGTEILNGGNCNKEKGFFVSPTLIQTNDPHSKLMEEEIFGPVLCVYVYENDKLDETLELVNSTSPYALTGGIFARDRLIIRKMTDALSDAAGNFYINDKTTGAVVGQQPFGGSRMSGTNDKAGSKLNLLRWVNCRTIKEAFSFSGTCLQ